MKARIENGNVGRTKSKSERRDAGTDTNKLEERLRALLPKGITRRDFMRLAAGAGLMLSVDHIFGARASADAGPHHEKRTYYFDLSHADLSNDADREYHLVSGHRKYRLKRVNTAALRRFRRTSPQLGAVPDSRITHYVSNTRFPRHSHQLCYVKSSRPGSAEWRIESLFIHIPQDYENALAAHQRKNRGSFTGSQKLKLYGVEETPAICTAAEANDLPGSDCGVPDAYKTYFEIATSLIFNHPDVMSLDTGSATYVLNQIVCTLDETKQLAGSIYNQMKNGGSWAIHTPIIDPDTGQPYQNDGQDQYSVTWTDETNLYAGKAINAVVKILKNDISLGANVTDQTSGAATGGTKPDFNGKLWLMRDGVPSVVNPGQAALTDTAGPSHINYVLVNQSTERGYNIPSCSVAATLDPSMCQVTVEVHNWYIRYLGLYVRYLDADGNILPRPGNITSMLEDWQRNASTEYDTLWGIIDPEIAVLGIPVADFDHRFSFPVPETASSVMLIAGGLGTGDTNYPDTISLGATTTVVVNLAIPTLFLIAAAASAYAGFASDLQRDTLALALISVTFAGSMDKVIYGKTNDPHVFMNLAAVIGGLLLKKAATWLITKITASISRGAAMNAIPLIGSIISAIAAAGTAAQIGETIGEVVRSPKTFDYKLALTHDVTVNIDHDPKDTSGYPATAATYEVIAHIDKATTRTSGLQDITDRSRPVWYTFKDLPYGGKVKYTVGFYAETGWCAGQGETDVMDNTVDSVSITIAENEVPLTKDTYYWHLQKTALDPSGSLIWSGNHQSPAPAPTAKASSLNCGNPPGRLCSIGGITISETYAALGLTWQSSSAAVSQCGGTGTGQFYQFGTLSTFGPPGSSAIVSNCGSGFPFMMVFSLLGNNQENYYLDPTAGRYMVRQIRFTGPGQGASYDPPGSNLAVARLNLPSDGMLLHTEGQLISINRQMSVMEIVTPCLQPVADDIASVATTASGPGSREGLMSGPACIGITRKGTILVLESLNQRIQAFDIGGNPVRIFKGDSCYFPLKSESESVYYLSMAVEYAGYIYVLSCGTVSGVYHLDIYTPDGTWLSRTSNVNAGALTIDLWRNVYTLNYEPLVHNGITSPSVSLWIPSVPAGF